MVKALRYYSEGPGIDSRLYHWEFFPWFSLQNHVPWGRLSLWKWVPWISPGVKAAGAFGWRPTTLVVPNVKKIRGLNLPGTPWATSACCGTRLLYFNLAYALILHKFVICAYMFCVATLNSTSLGLCSIVCVNGITASQWKWLWEKHCTYLRWKSGNLCFCWSW